RRARIPLGRGRVWACAALQPPDAVGPPAGLAAPPRGRRVFPALRRQRLPAHAPRRRADLRAGPRLLGNRAARAARPMSEDDEDGDARPPGLPPGTPFYMPPAGAAALREELRALWEDERPKVVEIVSWAASLGDRSENADYQYGKRRLRQIDGRVRFLRK